MGIPNLSFFGESKYGIDFGMCRNIGFNKELFRWVLGPHLTSYCPRAL